MAIGDDLRRRSARRGRVPLRPSLSASLRTLPRLAYQPVFAAPFLGPRVIGSVVPRALRVGWGERSTYDEPAEEIYAATLRPPERALAGSRYYRAFLAHEIGRGPSGKLRVPTRLLFGMRDPLGVAAAEGFKDTVLLEDCGHFVPEEVAAAARELCA